MNRINANLNGATMTDVERIKAGMRARRSRTLEEAMQKAASRPAKRLTRGPYRQTYAFQEEMYRQRNQMLAHWDGLYLRSMSDLEPQTDLATHI